MELSIEIALFGEDFLEPRVLDDVRLGRLRPTRVTKTDPGDGPGTCTSRLNKLPARHNAMMMCPLILPGDFSVMGRRLLLANVGSVF